MMKQWFLLLASLAVVSAATTTTKPRLDAHVVNNCIEHCQCQAVLSQAFSVNIVRVLSCNKPIILNKSSFDKVGKEVIALSFENIIIEQIQEDAFTQFKYLEDVVFRKCHIGAIDAKTFNNVKKVNFADCRFEDRPDFVSEKLEELHFGNCQLEDIPKLNNLLSLTFLNLSGNYIKNIEIDAFAELFDLSELYMTDNEIFKLPPTIFINNRELNTLYLDNNPLKEFRLNTTENLVILSLRNCQLEKFDERSTQKLSTINELNLSHNKLRSISKKTFSNMKELAFVDLSHNYLTHLDDDIFSKNPKLNKIILDGNSFESLPHFYLENGDKFATNTLSCNKCGLSTLSGKVFENMSLLSLYLSHNHLRTVEDVFDRIPSLVQIDISYNNISKFSKRTFHKNHDLVKINIAGNPLVVLDPEVFSDNQVLSEIDARNASLSRLWSKHNVRLQNLEKILLGNNNLTTLTLDDFDVMPSLEGIDLNNNPLIFSMDLCEVLESLKRRLGKTLFVLKSTQKQGYSSERNLEEDTNGFITSELSSFMSGKCFLEGFDDSSYDDDDEENDDDDFDYDNDDEEEDEDEDEEVKDPNDMYTHNPFFDEDHNNNVARASYILSITSVFVLSALVVLTVAVTITLCILKKNSNMQRANLPRLKIPLWTTTGSQKKHSGSVYRPLSEEIVGPTTPKFNRYEFDATPTVHSSNP